MSNWAIGGFIVGVLFGAGIMYNEGAKVIAQRDLTIAQAQKDTADYVASVQTERYQHALAIQKLQNKIGEIDVEYTQQLAASQKENARLADCLRSGKCGLRLTGSTSAPAAVGTGAAAGNTGLDNGNACRLTARAERHYLALSDGLAKQRAQLLAAQEILLLCEKGKQDGKRDATQ